MLTATNLDVSLGTLQTRLNGSLVGAGQHVRMSVDAKAADSVMVRKIARLDYLPAGQVIAAGDVELSEGAIRLTDTTARIGDFIVTADGSLDLQPLSNDSDLAFSIEGPSLSEAGKIVGLAGLPGKKFAVSGAFDGTPTGFEMRDFVARVGESDMQGAFDVNLDGKPRVVGDLRSTRLDLSDQLQPSAENEAPEQEKDDAGDGRLFSDKPLDTSWLQSADIDLDIRVGEFVANAIRVTDVDVQIQLKDGGLSIDPIHFRENAGRLEAAFSLIPSDGEYRLQSWVEIDNVHVGLLVPGEENIATLPTLGGKVRFEGAGGSIRSIMASSNGQIALRQGAGKVREVFGSALFRDVLLEVLRTLNPRRRSRNYQLLECGIYEVSINDGRAKIDNFVIQTDSMTTVARGEINLGNERLDIAFRAKPREGIGISLGTVANQLLEVRGTLKSPRIALDAGRTATTTGAAVATGGLSLLARGLWDRLSAEGDICKQEPQKK